VSLVSQVLKGYVQLLKKAHGEQGWGWLMHCSSSREMGQQETPVTPKRQVDNPTSRKEQPQSSRWHKQDSS